jgi:hypothetical protein
MASNTVKIGAPTGWYLRYKSSQAIAVGRSFESEARAYEWAADVGPEFLIKVETYRHEG